MEEPILKLLGAAFLGAVFFIDRWAIRNFEASESARAWCKSQFFFSRDPRGPITISSYIAATIAVGLAISGGAQLLLGLAG